MAAKTKTEPKESPAALEVAPPIARVLKAAEEGTEVAPIYVQSEVVEPDAE